MKSKTSKILEENTEGFLKQDTKRANHRRLLNSTTLKSNLFIKRHNQWKDKHKKLENLFVIHITEKRTKM